MNRLNTQISANMDSWVKNQDNGAPQLSVFVERELESIEAKLYRRIENELFWESDVPVDMSDPEGCDSVTYKRLGRFGIAKWINGSSSDLPSVGLYMEEFNQKVHQAGVSFGWDYFQMLSANKSGFPLSTEEAEAARTSLNNFLNDVCYFGAQSGDGIGGPKTMFGLTNHPDVTIYNLAAGATTTVIPWTGKNAAEIELDMINIIGTGQDLTRGKFFKKGMKLLVPPAVLRVLELKKITHNDSAPATLSDLFLKPSFGISAIEGRYELDAAAIDGGGRGILYHPQDDVLKMKIPHPIKALYDLQNVQALKINIPVVVRTAGIQLKLPMAVIYIDGIA